MAKHERYVEQLCEQLKDEYDTIVTNVLLYSKKRRSKGKRVAAEIDVVAYKGDRCDIFEVKCSYKIVKARHQLQRIKRLFPNVVNAYFFCGASGACELVA